MSRWPDQPSTSVAPGAGARRWPTEGAAPPSASGPLLAGLGASRPAAAARPGPPHRPCIQLPLPREACPQTLSVAVTSLHPSPAGWALSPCPGPYSVPSLFITRRFSVPDHGRGGGGLLHTGPQCLDQGLAHQGDSIRL